MRLLLGLFFLTSGMSSLLYQMAWQRLLGLSYGVGAISSAIVISAFLFGLGLGSLFGGHFTGPNELERLLPTWRSNSGLVYSESRVFPRLDGSAR